MRICVYCSSSPEIDPKYISFAGDVGTAIATRGWELVTGGGHISMMGSVSHAAREAGGRTIGIIPQRLADIEFADEDSDELHVVKSMRERKAMMEDYSDAFITLPGGPGTLEEFFEIWVGRYLKFHNKPVIVLDPFNFYAPLHAFLEHLTQEKFIRTGQRDLIIWTDSIESALSACANAAD
ncbi:unannotated protein [freshwater metagenome]|uniref:Unannotated protein n=1 Tax=freshwater metagenome TaxID=449393 RepID=A0A6J7J832_9ZZZZ|nr:TIGR00730 family Rossman fold protein [Actinomycetota bacterium]MSW35388.1 TIGR00730 family Rossman fold protein [Actinomycetota bacterium]